MQRTKWLILPMLTLALSGCAGMFQVTPELSGGTGDRKVEVKSKVMAVGTLDYAPNGKQLISGGATPTVRVWDLFNARGVRTHTIPAPFGLVDLAYSRDGRMFAASGSTGLFGGATTHVWDTESGKEIRVLPENIGFKLAFSRDGRYLFGNTFHAGSLVEPPYLSAAQYDLHSGTVVRTFPKHALGSVSPDGRHLLLIAEARKGVVLVEIESGREVWRNESHRTDAAAFTPNGRHIVATRSRFEGTLGTSASISAVLIDASTGGAVRDLFHFSTEGTFFAHEKMNQQLVAIAVSPDGQSVITGNNRGDYKLWDLASGKLLHALRRPDEKLILDMSPAHVAFSPNGSLIAITSAASVRLYNTATGEEAAAMIAFDDGEWLVSTPSGYYSASERGDEYLSVTVAGQPFSIAQLRESFYRPDLVKIALAGGTLGDFRKVAEIKPPPAVSIVDIPASASTQKISVSIRVSDQGGGIGDVRLYRNGSAVVLDKAQRRGRKKDAQGSQLLHFDIPLEPGQNSIRAIAFNADNSMQSADAIAEVQANIAARQPALYAIVVGIKEFANARLALKYSVADAELFASTLENRGKGLYSAVNVRRLLKPAETTNAAIVDALMRARQEVGPDDLFVFYVASHGTVDDGQYLLLTSNVGSTSSARLKSDALTQDTLKELISNIPASKKLVVLDTCSAGQLGDALQVAMLTRGMSDDTAMKVLSRAVGSTVLSAATSVQEALEGYKGHGLFTYVIAAGLNGAADANRDGYVKTLELADYVDSQVPELAEKLFRHKQYPIVSPTGQGFPLVKTR